MKNKTTVIKLLVKIANKEKLPIIKHDGKYGKYDKENKCYRFYNDKKCKDYFGSWFNWQLSSEGLNTELEIVEKEEVEKPKEINLIDEWKYNQSENDIPHFELAQSIKELQKAVNHLLKKESKQ